MNNTPHYVIDLETLGKGPRAAIAAIGCVEIIDGALAREFYVRVDLASAMSHGCEVDASTIQWWLKQPDEARVEVNGVLPTQSLWTALGELIVFLGGYAPLEEILVWGNGATFDNVILSNAYAAVDLARPWQFWNDRDLRTLLALYPEAKNLPFEGIKHHALDDARHEAKQLIAALQHHAANTQAPSPPIQPKTVVRDELGHWTHPAWPRDGEEDAIPKSWFAEKGLELFIVEMEADAPEEITDQYFERGDPNCSSWQPSCPPGNGWFIFSIHETDDGPVCVWVRSGMGADLAEEHGA